MTEPSKDPMMQAVTTLIAFVRAFRLPFNPEGLCVRADDAGSGGMQA